MFDTPQLRSMQRCELYLGLLLLVVSAAFVFPPLLALIGLPVAANLSVTLMVAGLQGLLSFSLLGLFAAPFLH